MNVVDQLYPYLVPVVQKVYRSMPTASQGEPPAANEQAVVTSPQTNIQQLENLERRTLEVIQKRPDPRVVAFAWTFTMALLVYALLLRLTVRALRPKTA